MEEGRLFLAIMHRDEEILQDAVSELETEFGEAVSKSAEYNFNFTDYYKDEFGYGLKKRIYAFGAKINKADLVETKILCSLIELRFSDDDDGKRVINIDPGYFSEKEAVLASFKEKDFKENLGDGVFAHKVLEFNGNKINDFFHTFADFKSKAVQEFFLELIK